MPQYFLDIANPGQPSQRFELPAGSYTIGRSEACKIRLRHPEISERHALLSLLENGQALVKDLHSSNGTLVDGVPVQEPTLVREDDVIAIGPCLLRVSPAQTGAKPAAQPPSAQPPPAPPPLSLPPPPQRRLNPSPLRRRRRSCPSPTLWPP